MRCASCFSQSSDLFFMFIKGNIINVHQIFFLLQTNFLRFVIVKCACVHVPIHPCRYSQFLQSVFTLSVVLGTQDSSFSTLLFDIQDAESPSHSVPALATVLSRISLLLLHTQITFRSFHNPSSISQVLPSTSSCIFSGFFVF